MLLQNTEILLAPNAINYKIAEQVAGYFSDFCLKVRI